MKYAMLIDQTKCIGCGACTVECKGKYDEASYGVLRTEMRKFESGSYPDVKLRYTKHACMHCFVAACKEVCPVDAIWHVEGEEGGMVEIDIETCIGCGACVGACPFEVPVIDEEREKAEKCSFCAFRVVEGESTYCAEACPVGAISFGEREDLIAQGESRVDDLQAAGRDKAHLYGKDDTGVLILIDDDYEVYDLVAEGFTLSSIGWRALSSYGSLAVAAAIGGIGYRVVKNRLDELSKEREEETQS